ncbi:MAG: ABC transporter permease [Bacteroidetes bacterium]|nr:ABC transporter permease [Bacteroidota bacterium]
MSGFLFHLPLFRNREYISSASLSRLAWRRFRRDPVAFPSFLFICLTAVIAILGYLITPDPTPFSNQQFLELGTLKPGKKITMLKTAKTGSFDHISLISKMMYGEKSRYDYIPVGRYQVDGNIIRANSFTGIDEETGQEMRYDRSKTPVEIITRHFWLGTDRYGRDMLSQLIIGTRVSLAVGLISVFLSLLIGITIGSIGGFFGGWVDQLVMWLINVVWSIPTLLLVIAITFALGRGFWQVFIAVGLTMWVEVARVVRGQILSIREKEYVEAAKAMGFTNARIIFRHIVPNLMSPVIVISAANFASAILLEAGLSFLGIGVQPPMPSWGSMIRENYGYIILDSAHLAILPGLAIMLMVLAFMLVGNGLRDALDVRTH